MKASERPLAIVTGAGSGIGRATALRLAQTGYVCILVGRREEFLKETAGLVSDSNGFAIPIAADVTTEEGRSDILKAADTASSPLHAVVNNAGDTYMAPLFSQDLQKWRENFALNLEAAAFLSFESIRRMKDTGQPGAIVNVASVYGIVALRNEYYGGMAPENTPEGPVRGVSYSTSKAAVRMLSRELAVAAAKIGVRVNTVSPGMIKVERYNLDQERLASFSRATPMGRWGHPEEVANTIAFLLSAEASFITGAEIVVDGGWTLW